MATFSKALTWLPFGVIAGLILVGCQSLKGTLPQEEGLHPRLTRFAYIEEGKLATLIVDTEASRQREKQAVVPLAIAIANNGLPRFTLTRESLTLVDQRGRRYALASVPEAKKVGGLQGLDYRLSESFFGVVENRFTAHTELQTVFFPVSSPSGPYSGRGLLREVTELPKQSWTRDVIYFPHPEGEWVGGRYELWLNAKELEQPVFVKFAIL
jgi:hypothetical protein